MSLTNRSATSIRMQRSINSCSTPHSSGHSARIPLPPSTTSRSAVCPMAGFAECPEQPSEPPHFTPSVRVDNGAGFRSALSASTQPRNVSAINLGSGETELLFKRLLQNGKIAVFAKHQRKHDPIVPRTHLAIGSVVPGEGFCAPRRDIGRRPGAADLLRLVEFCGGVAKIARRK